MHRSFLPTALLLTIFGLTSCVVPTQVRELQSVQAGKIYAGPILNITSPNSEGWYLLKSNPSGMAFSRHGSKAGDSFAAQVLIFNPPKTNSPEEFEALIVKGAQRDAETDRFSTTSFTHQFSSSRGYPCVQMKNISKDRHAQTGGNKSETLVMQNEHLYCRHPVQKNIGFAITYSHRGKDLHPNFENEAHSFIKGIQVPNNAASK